MGNRMNASGLVYSYGFMLVVTARILTWELSFFRLRTFFVVGLPKNSFSLTVWEIIACLLLLDTGSETKFEIAFDKSSDESPFSGLILNMVKY